MPYRRFTLVDYAPHLRIRGFRDSDERQLLAALELLRQVAPQVFRHLLREIRIIKRSIDCGLDPHACPAIVIYERTIFFDQHPSSMDVADVAVALGREALHLVTDLRGTSWFTPHACPSCQPGLVASASPVERWARATRRELAAAAAGDSGGAAAAAALDRR